MLKFIVKRLLSAVPVLMGVVLIIFAIFNFLPSDPAALAAGQRTDEATLKNIRQSLRLDVPAEKRFLLFLKDLSLVSLEEKSRLKELPHWYSWGGEEKCWVLKPPYLGTSFQSGASVNALIAEAFPKSFLLALAALIPATIGGLLLGLFAALKKGSFLEQMILSFTAFGVSLPSFFSGLLIAWLFGYYWSSWTGFNMSGGLYDYGTAGAYITFKNLILPAFTLSIRPLALITQLSRNALLEIWQKDFITTARARGLTESAILKRHALRNMLNPVITAVSGWLASLIVGAFFVEFIFDWKGLGKLTVDALNHADFPVVMGVLLLIATIIITINILVDICYVYLDPRVKTDD